MERMPEFSSNISEQVDIVRQERSLEEMIQQNPGIAEYVGPGVMGRGSATIGQIRTILTTNPYLVRDIEAVHDFDDPDQVTMAILPSFPLVISQSQNGLTAFAPILGCTSNAIRDLARKEGLHPGEYTVVNSSNGLMSKVVEMTENTPEDILTYQSKNMKPEDYIALGATGALYDEVFRANLREFSNHTQ